MDDVLQQGDGRPAGVSEQTFYRWKKVNGGTLPGETRELQQLREEDS